MMRAILTAGVLALAAGGVLAAEQVEVKAPAAPKLTKAEQIERLNREIFKAELRLLAITDAYIAETEKEKGKRRADMLRKDRAKATAALPGMRIERAWLKGEITLANAEKAVNVAEEAVAKAKDNEKSGAQAALDAARAELERVKKLEAAKDF